MQQPNPLLKLAPVTLTHTDGVAADAQTKHLRFGRLSMQMVQDWSLVNKLLVQLMQW